MFGFNCCEAVIDPPDEYDEWPFLNGLSCVTKNRNKSVFSSPPTLSLESLMALTRYQTVIPPDSILDTSTFSQIIYINTPPFFTPIPAMDKARLARNKVRSVEFTGSYIWEIWGVHPGKHAEDLVYPNDFLGPPVEWTLALAEGAEDQDIPNSPDIAALINAVRNHPDYNTEANPLKQVGVYIRPKTHPIIPDALTPWPYRSHALWVVGGIDVIEA